MQGKQEIPEAIGRAKTVLVLQTRSAKAAVSSILVEAATMGPGASRPRITWAGPVPVDQTVTAHFETVLLPIVDRIANAMNRPPCCFEFSIVNLSVYSVSELLSQVTGFSLDVPALISMISGASGLPLRQDVVATGHVASSQGDIRPVMGMSAKLQAAARDNSIRSFICPRDDLDISMEVSAPIARGLINREVIATKAHCRVILVSDLVEMLSELVVPRSLILAALKHGFFAPVRNQRDGPEPLTRVIDFLTSDHEGRFWKAVEEDFYDGHAAAACELLHARFKHHIAQGVYPSGFGGRLLLLLRSLPPHTRRLTVTFPLLDVGLCARLAALSSQADLTDCHELAAACLGKFTLNARRTVGLEVETAADDVAADPAVLEAVLAQINPVRLVETIGGSIDAARGAYTMESATAASDDEFFEVITGFYLHMLRCVGLASPSSVDLGTAEKGATDLVRHAFARESASPDDLSGPIRAAMNEARSGSRGRLRFVLDVITEQFKMEEQQKHIEAVLALAVDPMNLSEQVAFVSALFKQLERHLPPSIRKQDPKKYAKYYKQLAFAYATSLDHVGNVMRAM